MKTEKKFLLATRENCGSFGEVVLFAKKTNKGFFWTLSKNNAYIFKSHMKAKRTSTGLISKSEIYVVEQA